MNMRGVVNRVMKKDEYFKFRYMCGYEGSRGEGIWILGLDF